MNVQIYAVKNHFQEPTNNTQILGFKMGIYY
jgi:hypothetical protein